MLLKPQCQPYTEAFVLRLTVIDIVANYLGVFGLGTHAPLIVSIKQSNTRKRRLVDTETQRQEEEEE